MMRARSVAGAASNKALNDLAVDVVPGEDGNHLLEPVIVPAPTTWECIFSVRTLVSVLLFCGLFIAYAMRVLMSSTVGAIAEQYGYDNQQVGLILSSFFIGYVMLQLLGGYWATKYGGLHIIGLGMLCASIFTALTPFAAHNMAALVWLRILTGLSESVIYPSVHALLGQWAPRNERSILLTSIWSGAYVGTTVTLPVCSALMANASPLSSVFLRGWPAVFYLFGTLGGIWALFWMFFAASTPEEHGFISKQEKQYIIHNRQPEHSKEGAHVITDAKARAPLNVPWRKLLLHPAVISLAVVHAAHNWLYYVILTWLPEYLRQQLNYDIKEIGAVAALPYLACFFFSVLAGFIADALLSRGICSRNVVRKTAQTIGEVLPAVTVVLAAYLHGIPAIIGMLTLSVGLSGVANAGYGSSHLDMAPQYAGILLGYGNTLATIPGIIAPMVVGAMVSPPHNDKEHWRQAFWLSAGICLAGWLVFMFFGQTEAVDFDAVPSSSRKTSNADEADIQPNVPSKTAIVRSPEELDSFIQKDHIESSA